MYDIFFDLSDMHQVVELEDTPFEKLSKLYDELAAVERIRFTREQMAASFNKGFMSQINDETSFILDGENFNFELDLPELMPAGEDATEFCTIKYVNGINCDKCNEYYPYAEESNQRDGTFKCYSCRKYG